MTTSIDQSELRPQSKLKNFISDMVYEPLPDLESKTGADCMISPDGIGGNIQYRIDNGALLIQLKIGHDLPSSIVDGRFNMSLSKMLATNAQSWQCLSLFVGILDCDSNGMATIDGQTTYTDHPMSYKQIKSALEFWTERGGSHIFPLSRGELIPAELSIHQNHLNRFAAGEKERILWPKQPAFYDNVEGVDPLLKEWLPAQELKPVKDIRITLATIPGFGMGRVDAIFDYMEINNIRQDLNGFIGMTRGDKPSILEVKGVGKKSLDTILWWFWRTEKERLERIK